MCAFGFSASFWQTITGHVRFRLMVSKVFGWGHGLGRRIHWENFLVNFPSNVCQDASKFQMKAPNLDKLHSTVYESQLFASKAMMSVRWMGNIIKHHENPIKTYSNIFIIKQIVNNESTISNAGKLVIGFLNLSDWLHRLRVNSNEISMHEFKGRMVDRPFAQQKCHQIWKWRIYFRFGTTLPANC